MSKLRVILLSVAILALLGALFLGLTMKNRRVGIEGKLDEVFTAHFPGDADKAKDLTIEKKIALLEENAKNAKNNLAKTAKDLGDMTALRDGLTAQLAETKGKLDATETNLRNTSNDLTKTRNELQQAVAQRDQLAHDADDAQKEVNRLKPFENMVDQEKRKTEDANRLLADARQKIAAFAEENKVLLGKVESQEKTIKELVTVRADLKGTVLLSDAPWGFVVLNVGRADNIVGRNDNIIGPDKKPLEATEFFVYRGGQLQGKVRVLSTEQNVCVADVISPTAKTKIVPGDLIVYSKLSPSETATTTAPTPAAATQRAPAVAPSRSTPAPAPAPARPQPKRNFN